MSETADHNIPHYLTVGDLALLLNVSKSKIYGLTRKEGSNSIPRIKIGKYVRFEPVEIKKWLDSHRVN